MHPYMMDKIVSFTHRKILKIIEIKIFCPNSLTDFKINIVSVDIVVSLASPLICLID